MSLFTYILGLVLNSRNKWQFNRGGQLMSCKFSTHSDKWSVCCVTQSGMWAAVSPKASTTLRKYILETAIDCEGHLVGALYGPIYGKFYFGRRRRADTAQSRSNAYKNK